MKHNYHQVPYGSFDTHGLPDPKTQCQHWKVVAGDRSHLRSVGLEAQTPGLLVHCDAQELVLQQYRELELLGGQSSDVLFILCEF